MTSFSIGYKHSLTDADADALCCFVFFFMIKYILSDESYIQGNHGQFPRIKCAKLNFKIINSKVHNVTQSISHILRPHNKQINRPPPTTPDDVSYSIFK